MAATIFHRFYTLKPNYINMHVILLLKRTFALLQYSWPASSPTTLSNSTELLNCSQYEIRNDMVQDIHPKSYEIRGETQYYTTRNYYWELYDMN